MEIIKNIQNKAKIIICAEKNCMIIYDISYESISQFLTETKSFYININPEIINIQKNCIDFNAIKDEIGAFCNYFSTEINSNDFVKETIKSIAIYLIRKNFYPSWFFKSNQQSNSNSFESNIESEIDDDNKIFFEEFNVNDFINLHILYSISSESTFNLVLHVKKFKIFMMKRVYDSYNKKSLNEEINFCKKCKNRCIVPFYGFVKENKNIIGFIYEFMPNGTLNNYLKKIKGKVSIFFYISTIIRIYEGINYIHSCSFIHRDLKPSNILLNRDFICFINDFDRIKKIANESSNINMTVDFGNIQYISPEQYQGIKKLISYPTDIYSFGKIIYFLFQNSFNTTKSNKLKDIQDICDKCIKNNPNERPSIDEIKHMLYKYIKSSNLFDQYFIIEKKKYVNNEELYQYIYECILYIVKYFSSVRVVQNLKCFSDLFASISKGEISQILYEIGHFYYTNDIVKYDYQKVMEYYSLSSEFGNSYGIMGLGDLYYNGHGVQKNVVKALEYYEIAAKQCNPKSLYMLGYIYMNGIGVNIDYIQAKKYFQLSSDQNFSQAFKCLGDIYLKGRGVDKNIETALNYYKSAIKLNNNNALYALGTIYYTGNGVEKDYKKAKTYYELAIKLNNIKAFYALGCIYFYGRGTDRDYAKSREYFEIAANNGDAKACYCLGKLYYDGKGVFQDFQKALKYYTLAAEKNNSDALNGIGVLYLKGYGVKINYNKALEYFEKSAKLKNCYAYDNLADFYLKGYNVAIDFHKAKYYYELSAKSNNADAFYGLGEIYYKGYDGIQNINEALKYFNLAANDNHSAGFYKIGKIFLNGKFIKPDYIKAKKNFEKASIFNHPNSYFYLGIIYFKGMGIKCNYFKSLKNFLLSAQLKNFKASYYAGLQYEKGLGAESDLNKALKNYFQCLECENLIYFIDYKSGTIEKQKKNINYRYRSANNIGLIYLLDKKNYEKSGKYLQISSNNEYPIGQNNYGVFCFYFIDNKEKSLAIFSKASKHHFDLIEFNYARCLELYDEKKEAEKHYKNALLYENNDLTFRLKTIKDEELDITRLFTNFYLYLRFCVDNTLNREKKRIYLIRAIFRPVFTLLFQSNCDSFQFNILDENYKLNINGFIFQFPLFNFENNSTSQNGWLIIEKESKNRKRIILSFRDNYFINSLFHSNIDKKQTDCIKNIDELDFFDPVNFAKINNQVEKIILQIFYDLNKSKKFRIIKNGEFLENKSFNEIRFASNDDNIERCLQYPKLLTNLFLGSFDLSIKETIELMEKKMFTRPFPILFGRLLHTTKNKKPQRKQLNNLFYQGFDILINET